MIDAGLDILLHVVQAVNTTTSDQCDALPELPTEVAYRAQRVRRQDPTAHPPPVGEGSVLQRWKVRTPASYNCRPIPMYPTGANLAMTLPENPPSGGT